MAFQHGALDQAWQATRAGTVRAAIGRWSWPVSLTVIAGFSVLGWSAIIFGIARLIGS